ncbi:MAG TPA: right-handed parallel beta-helix repeat-containing protein [Myxococcales bacterium]
MALACGRGRSGPRPVQASAVVFVGEAGPGAADGSAAHPFADGSAAHPFADLQQALDAAPDGALLRLAAGEFEGPVRIERSVRIVGAGPRRTVIRGTTGLTVDVRAPRVELRGLGIASGSTCLSFTGGDHRLAQVELRSATETGLLAKGARISFRGGAIRDVGDSSRGRGVDVEGGAIELRSVVFRSAGRRAIVLHRADGLIQDVNVSGSALSAVQATAGASVRVIRGSFEGLGGAALYAGGSSMSVEGAVVDAAEYGVIGFRGAQVVVRGGKFSRYGVAGVALVGSHGSISDAQFTRGGSEGAISVSFADGELPILLTGNRIQEPGPIGIHVTESAVTVRGNSITGARPDAQGDLGDAVYAMGSRVIATENVLRGNAGSGIAATRTSAFVFRNGFIENRRAGLLLLDRSRGMAGGNLFLRNAQSGVEVGEASRVELDRNRFSGNRRFDVDSGCGKGSGTTRLDAPVRERTCPK